MKLDFSVNTNPMGLPKEIRNALAARMDEFSHYPDPCCRELCAAISIKEEVPVDWILCGNGAADLIYRLCYAVIPNKALVCAPTFSEYELALDQLNCNVIYHHLIKENQFTLTRNILGKLTPDIDMLFICNPNNPTGRLVSQDLLHQILTKAAQNGTTIVIDECFLDFTNGTSAKTYLAEMPNLVILKAFTKMYAMAGLRLGYMITSNMLLMDKTYRAAQCWSVSTPAQIAGITALSLSTWQETTRKATKTERQFLSENLKDLGLLVYPSDANYIIFYSERELYEPLLQRGILIRSCKNYIGLTHAYYRVGVKTRADNFILLRAIKEILHG